MIVLFTYKKRRLDLDLIYYFIQTYPYKYKILTKFNKSYFNKAKIIIPFGISSQIKLSEYPEYNHKYLICDDNNVYDILDDKIKFYNFIKKYNLLENSNIELINTYDESYDGPDKYDKFILKDKNGEGSTKNKIVEGYLFEYIKKYAHTHQIQDIIDIGHINCVNCLCKNGKIISALNFTVPKFIDTDHYRTTHKLYFEKVDPIYLELINKTISRLNYTGFIEFEFITDKEENNYLMECNPRISGHFRCTFKNNKSPYVLNLVYPYCDLITNSKIDITDYEGKNELIYIANINRPDYDVCSCNILKFNDE